ncbi:MAG: hypothetical protein ACHQ4H_03635 [Ktedonobacterales bacterium]
MHEMTASGSGTEAARSVAPTETSAVASSPGGWSGSLVAWMAHHPRAPLLLACMIAVVARVFLVIRTHAMIDGDEALLGIQAERILRGQYPTYFYAQPYMGSLEAYFAAALFRVFGPSSWALRAVPVVLSLALVYLTWRLARALLPAGAPATPLLAGLAALVAAAPPLYDAVAELRTWGGQIEVYVVIVALLLCAVELADRLRAGARTFELARRWAVLGFFAGLGIWINPLITYALAACLLWLLPPLARRTFAARWRRWTPAGAGPSPLAAFSADAGGRGQARSGADDAGRDSEVPLGADGERVGVRTALLPLLAIIPGLALGGLPAWLYALRHAGANLLVYIQQPYVSPAVSGAARHGRLFLGAAISARYASCVAPRVLDGGLPAEPLSTLPLRLLLLLPALGGIICAVWLVRQRATLPLRAGLPLLFAGIVTAIFCLGTSAWASTKPCASDWAGRYAVPLALVEPLLLLALFAAPRVWSALRVRFGRHALSAQVLRRGWTLALVTLLAGGVLQAASYALADPVATFQSPYYQHVPLDMQPLLSYVESHHITDAWCNHWLGNIVTFETNGRTTCADYYDQVTLGGLRRPPGTLEAVSAATRPSFILIGQGAHPLLAQELDAQGIAYTLAYIPRSNVTVITPASTVNPASVVAGLAADFI